MSQTQQRAVLYLRVSTESQTGRDGDSEGYSIPAQREAGTRKAEELGAKVVAEFSDPGITGRSDQRPGLQALLERIRTKGDINLVIVWKLSRMSRSPLIDENLELEFLAHGVRLISCTENIDVTPSGRLLRRILGTINAYEIDNLAQNVSSGMARKVKTGGTVMRAPLGYLNVRKMVNGMEVRSIEIDPERAVLVRWLFEAYASGSYTLTQLHELAVARGMSTRPTRKQPAKPISRSVVGKILVNPYYTGVVTYKGVEYPGRHEPLISTRLFVQVQEMLAGNRNGQKTQQHQHYFKGTLRCKRCESRMSLTFSQGKGGIYPYFFCLGRQKGNGCDQPYLPVDQVEARVSRHYDVTQIEPELAQALRVGFIKQLREEHKQADAEARRQARRLEKLKKQSAKLLDAHYDDLIEPELFASEQRRIKKEVVEAENAIAEAKENWQEIERGANDLFGLLDKWGDVFRRANEQQRRRISMALYDAIYVDGDKDVIGEIAEPPSREKALTYLETALAELSAEEAAEAAAAFEAAFETENRPLVSVGAGANIVSLVDQRRFELLTSPVRGVRSTN